jgi:hypothetical protein
MPNAFSRSLLRSCHTVRKGNKREIYRKRENERAMNTVECIESRKAAVIQSEKETEKERE